MAGERIASPSLYVRETGSGASLLLLHGLASSCRYWEPHFDTLSRSFHVIAPDLLGFGRSPQPQACAYTPADHLAALRQDVVPRLTRPATVVGHSMGAVVALHLAAAEPALVGQLILVSLPVIERRPFGHTAEGGLHRLHRFVVHSRTGRALCSAGVRTLAPAAAAVYPRLRPDLPPGAARDAARADWTAYWRTLEATVFGSDVPALFATVRAPITVLHGRSDLVAPVERVRAMALARPDVRYVEVGAGHNPCFTNPTAFYDLLGVAAQPGPTPRPYHPLTRLLAAGRGRLLTRIAATR